MHMLLLIASLFIAWRHEPPSPRPLSASYGTSIYLGIFRDDKQMVCDARNRVVLGAFIALGAAGGDYDPSIRVTDLAPSQRAGIRGTVGISGVSAASIKAAASSPAGIFGCFYIDRDEDILLPSAIFIEGDRSTVLFADTLGIVGPSSNDWKWLEKACDGLDGTCELRMVFDGLASLKDLCDLRTDPPLGPLHVLMPYELEWIGM